MDWARLAKVVRSKLTTKRTLVTSDIHGNLGLFQQLLSKMNYRSGEDTLVILGDLVQKGPENLGTIRFMMELAREKNVFVLAGNNDMLIDETDEHALEYISYFREISLLGELAQSIDLPFPNSIEETVALRKAVEKAYPAELGFLRGLPHILETETFLFAHAGLKNEKLEEQTLHIALEERRFHETVEHVFQKLLLVGHWPAANYRTDRLSNAPIYNELHHVLSIDGGQGVKRFGQLNGVILDNETGAWTWTSTDSFPKIAAPCSQKAQSGVVVTWPENDVEVLQKGETVTRCRAKSNGEILDIPNGFLHEEGTRVRTSDITTRRLAVEKGEMVGVVGEYGDRLLIVKEGEAGFLFLPEKNCR